jgi:aminoglycoside 2''-phosphotransferase
MQKDNPNLEQELIAKTRAEFPTLTFDHVSIANNGDDHAVLIFDNKRVVRFPRNEKYTKSFQQELGLLAALKEHTQVAVPFYDSISKKRDCGSYAFIQGQELRVSLFDAFSSTVKEKLAHDLGVFLSDLHSLPHDIISIQHDRWHFGDMEWYKDRYTQKWREVIVPFVRDDLLKEIDQFYERFSRMHSTTRVVMHGDLTDDHMLVTEGGALAGVIDFADASIGDPAYDFTYFWSYGDDVPVRMYEAYRYKEDIHLLDRSRWYFVHFQVDNIYEASRDGKVADVDAIVQGLRALLSKLPSM